MFVIVEVVFNGSSPITYPVAIDKPLFELCMVLSKSEDVVAYRVIDGHPVLPDNYGWGKFNKWVLKFEEEHFGS